MFKGSFQGYNPSTQPARLLLSRVHFLTLTQPAVPEMDGCEQSCPEMGRCEQSSPEMGGCEQSHPEMGWCEQSHPETGRCEQSHPEMGVGRCEQNRPEMDVGRCEQSGPEMGRCEQSHPEMGVGRCEQNRPEMDVGRCEQSGPEMGGCEQSHPEMGGCEQSCPEMGGCKQSWQEGSPYLGETPVPHWADGRCGPRSLQVGGRMGPVQRSGMESHAGGSIPSLPSQWDRTSSEVRRGKPCRRWYPLTSQWDGVSSGVGHGKPHRGWHPLTPLTVLSAGWRHTPTHANSHTAMLTAHTRALAHITPTHSHLCMIHVIHAKSLCSSGGCEDAGVSVGCPSRCACSGVSVSPPHWVLALPTPHFVK
nr:uncharacterized protein LOC105709362 isoform X2 [Aotus nancymaae]